MMATQPSDTSKHQVRETTLADELAVITQRAQTFTGASAAAIAMLDDTTGEIVCVARCGASAPEMGAAVGPGSFTGMCILSGKELRCDDAETDPRVDIHAVRSLNIRSIVVIPVKDEKQVIGVLSVFAPVPHIFTITHVAVLKTMADQIAMLARKRRRDREKSEAV
ncbi:MAG TPA: GAF domain-containing protein [Candidatus Angelobacter sp.]|nr:GAF domain-containing protein [Candidatus Angelobacter sp.]